MHDKLESALKVRETFANKAEEQLQQVFNLSLEGDKAEFERVLEDLQTSLTIVWRFDRKLERLATEKFTKENI